MKNLYIRFTTNIEKDLENGCSVHFTGETENDRAAKTNEIIVDGEICEKINGHCAFDLEDFIEEYSIETIEELIEEIRDGFGFNEVYCTDAFGKDWVIVEGRYVENCPEGDVIIITDVKHKEYAF